MYLALARKYRPQDFTQVIGQEAVVRILGNAIEHERIHHAYLFCGARGVGKTSMARIFAKSINCVNGPTLKPCQTCDLCQSITRGSCMDVVEIDGASHTGVDNIRELREQVKYAPQEAKYKIYIIDEVHMLSTSAFNALLKTLEEPPPHVIFVFATTEPHKIPITILSRCQRYDFRKVSSAVLVNHLKTILQHENVQGEDGALKLIADCAQGSVRDAMSLIDQVIGANSAGLKEEALRQQLGLADRLLVQNTFLGLMNGDLNVSLSGLREADVLGLDLKLFSEDLLKLFHQTILWLSAQSLDGELSPGEIDFLKKASFEKKISLVLAQYQILYRGILELAHSEFQKTSLEITFVKMSQAPHMIDLTRLIAELKERASRTPSSPVNPSLANVSAQKVTPLPQVNPTPTKVQASGQAEDWYQLVKWIQQKKPSLGGLLTDAVPLEFSEQKIVVGFAQNASGYTLLIERKPAMEELLQSHFSRKTQFDVQILTDEKKKS